MTPCVKQPRVSVSIVKVKEYELAEIFDAATLSPPLPAPTPAADDAVRLPADDDYRPAIPSTTTTSTTTAATSYQRQLAAAADRGDDGDEDGQQNNETLRRKSKKSSKSAAHHSSHPAPSGGGSAAGGGAMLKTLVAEYSRDERAKKNRRGRKSANLSKFPSSAATSAAASGTPVHSIPYAHSALASAATSQRRKHGRKSAGAAAAGRGTPQKRSAH